jgi:hypothetical protein
MGEISNIQTYAKVTEANYQLALDKFALALKAIGLWNDAIAESMASFKWERDDVGAVFSTFTAPPDYAARVHDMQVSPYVFICLLTGAQKSDDYWLAFNLYLETEELQNFYNGEYYQETYPLIKHLTLAMHKELDQTGVYFTDELQDMEALEAFSEKDLSKLWEFDYAIIPNHLAMLYSKPPSTHTIKKHEIFIEAWYSDRWKEPA